jgi:trigger factor
MKKKLAILLMTTLAVSTLMVGCGEDKNKDKTTESTETSSTEQSSTEQGVVNPDHDHDHDHETEVDVTKLYELSEYEKIDFDTFVKFGDYSKIITLKESDYTVTDEDLQKEIDYYRELYGTTPEIKDRAVAKDDTVVIDFVGKLDGKEFEGGTAKAQELKIGSKSYIDGFEDGLIGVKPGETVSLNLTFPKEYSNSPEMAGKAVVFEVTVNYIKGATIPAEYNDELVSKITDGDYKTVDTFNEYIKSYIESQKKQTILSTFKTELLKVTEFTGDITKFVEEEYNHGIEYYKSYADSAGYTLEEFAKACGYKTEQELLDYIKADSETYVKEKIMIYAFGKKVNIEMTKEQTEAGAQKIVSLYGYGSLESLLTQYNPSIIRFDIFSDLISTKVIEMYK